MLEQSWHGSALFLWMARAPYKRISDMATIVNWSRDEMYKIISLWSDDVIQEQLEGCRRNSQAYKKIAESLREAGFNRTFEQCSVGKR